jgi:arylformamidase
MPRPLVMFVHGGGWQRGSKDNASSRWLPAHLTQQGYAYASIDYRLVPAVAVEQQAEDVAHALRALLDRAAELGIDRRRVVLIGHSAGAHLVALVGTDERHLKSAGLGFADLRGVIANDGAAYDVPAQLQEDAPMMHQTYLEVFGSDPARQWALSPTHQAAAPNAPAFLLLHVQRPDAVRQTEALGRALAAAGSAVDYGSFAGTGLRGHMEINRRLGDPDYPATALVDGWLRKNLAE